MPRRPARSAAQRAPALSLSIQRGDRIDELPVSRTQLRRWVAAALDADAALTLRFVDAREGRMLNAAYRHRDYATNVLTFRYDETGDDDDQVRADIVICLPVVRREAREQRKTLRDHLAHLVIHGVLHAGGHDHEDPDEAQRMEAEELRLLARFRIADPYLVPSSGRRRPRG
ncbi:MAG: rRNA maturation RNase YbeY [Burkholderiaceae bacterium]